MKISLSFGLMHRLQPHGEAFFMQRICIPPIKRKDAACDFLLYLFMQVLH